MENELKKRAKHNKKHQKGRGWWVNPNAGDVPKAQTFFNHASGVDGGGITGGDASVSMEENLGRGKDELFALIKEINPNAREENYKNKDVNQMLAILSDMRKNAKKYSKDRFEEPNIEDYIKPENKVDDFTGIKKDWEDSQLYYYQNGEKGELATEEESEPEYYEKEND